MGSPAFKIVFILALVGPAAAYADCFAQYEEEIAKLQDQVDKETAKLNALPEAKTLSYWSWIENSSDEENRNRLNKDRQVFGDTLESIKQAYFLLVEARKYKSGYYSSALVEELKHNNKDTLWQGMDHPEQNPAIVAQVDQALDNKNADLTFCHGRGHSHGQSHRHKVYSDHEIYLSAEHDLLLMQQR